MTPQEQAGFIPEYERECDQSDFVTTRMSKAITGWWWGVWQGERLVAFGAEYKSYRPCMRKVEQYRKLAEQGFMPEVPCTNPWVEKHDSRSG